jgi:hypothetical protein
MTGEDLDPLQWQNDVRYQPFISVYHMQSMIIIGGWTAKISTQWGKWEICESIYPKKDPTMTLENKTYNAEEDNGAWISLSYSIGSINRKG